MSGRIAFALPISGAMSPLLAVCGGRAAVAAKDASHERLP
jgi:hypothetical protein